MAKDISDRVTIMVVDDYDDSRQIMRSLLEQRRYHVVEAANGETAIETAIREHPKIILMDLSMPFMDGFMAAGRIREHEGLEHVPIVAVSAYQISDFDSDPFAAGFNGYLQKPLDIDDMEKLLIRLLLMRQNQTATKTTSRTATTV
jgi:two-component system, cell cycle response regulator DivK